MISDGDGESRPSQRQPGRRSFWALNAAMAASIADHISRSGRRAGKDPKIAYHYPRLGPRKSPPPGLASEWPRFLQRIARKSRTIGINGALSPVHKKGIRMPQFWTILVAPISGWKWIRKMGNPYPRLWAGERAPLIPTIGPRFPADRGGIAVNPPPTRGPSFWTLIGAKDASISAHFLHCDIGLQIEHEIG